MSSQRERPLTDPGLVRELLADAGVSPSRELGQNFLTDANILRAIAKAAALRQQDVVIEVGAGLGALTELLSERCKKVFAVEVDGRLAGMLEERFGDEKNVVIVTADAVKLDFDSLFGARKPSVKMVANLPYGIAATLLVECLKHYPYIKDYTVTIQKEVAERMTAAAGGKEYSAATVKVGYRASVRKVASVSRNCFYPRPRVDSTILRLERFGRRAPAGAPPRARNESFLDLVVTAAFSQRRKKLVNALGSIPGRGPDRDVIAGAVSSVAGPDARAEQLSVEQYVKLADLLLDS